MKIDEERFDLVRKWCVERQAITDRKRDGMTDIYAGIDPNISGYHYCNLRRMDDRVSVWFKENWFDDERMAAISPQHRLFVCAVARQINLPESCKEIGHPVHWDFESAQSILKNRSVLGLKNFTAAYMLTGTLKKNNSKTPKYVQTTELILEPFYQKYVVGNRDVPQTMKGLHADLQHNPGFASFMAGQVTADARWAGVFDELPDDRHTWAPMGPGSYRGLNLLYNPGEEWFHQSKFQDYFQQFLKDFHSDSVTSSLYDRVGLEAHDVQNILCETSKYMAITLTGKKPKRKYRK